MSTKRRLHLLPIAASAALLVSLFGSATTALATGTCQGPKIESVIPAEQRDISPLAVYDENGDGIICLAEVGRRFKKVHYSDNRI